jgi:hypothetical protein
VRDEAHAAIRELAQNPLLLTIVALVHRIDAVLPDERVVLYQKCTETLLNTWHTWKFRDSEEKNRGKVERRNRARMEAIAYWMHCRGAGTAAGQRAIVPYREVHAFLTEHIARVERPSDAEREPRDLADEFLTFVKKRAGLLLELGDNQYSFVHLTFEEYLTSTYIITSNEKEGATGIWRSIKELWTDPRWHEVVRLLVAGLKSGETQCFLIKQMLSMRSHRAETSSARLLCGLLLDAIEPAEERREEILRRLISRACKAETVEDLRVLAGMLRSWLGKEPANESTVWTILDGRARKTAVARDRQALALVASVLDLTKTRIREFRGQVVAHTKGAAGLVQLFLDDSLKTKDLRSLEVPLDRLFALQDVLCVHSSVANFIAAAGQALASSAGPRVGNRRAFDQQLITLRYPDQSGRGPFTDLMWNVLRIGRSAGTFLESVAPDLPGGLRPGVVQDRGRVVELALKLALPAGRDSDRVGVPAGARARALDLGLDLELPWTQNLHRYEERFLESPAPWSLILSSPELYGPFLDSLCDAFGLEPRAQWWEALRVRFLPTVPDRIVLVREAWWKEVERAFASRKAGEADLYGAAWQLIFDAWLYMAGCSKQQAKSIVARLADMTRKRDDPPLRIAHCIRDLIYGDRSRTDDLVSMVRSNDPGYRNIFERCFWAPTISTGKGRA